VFLKDRYIWISIAIYLLLVVAGGGCLIAYRAPVDWCSARALGKNHRVTREDLKRPAEGWPALGFGLPDMNILEGRYLKTKVDAGRPVDPADVVLEPAIELAVGQSVMWVPLSDQAFPNTLLDSGTKVELCVSGENCFVGTVGALYCDKKTPAGCAAAVILKDDDRGKLMTVDGKNKIVLAVPTTKEVK
jgi:hypothetical protein